MCWGRNQKQAREDWLASTTIEYNATNWQQAVAWRHSCFFILFCLTFGSIAIHFGKKIEQLNDQPMEWHALSLDTIISGERNNLSKTPVSLTRWSKTGCSPLTLKWRCSRTVAAQASSLCTRPSIRAPTMGATARVFAATTWAAATSLTLITHAQSTKQAMAAENSGALKSARCI